MKDINASSVNWEFERVSSWANASNSLTTRLALFLNTIHALKQVSLEEPNSPFFFYMTERLSGEEFNLLPSHTPKYLATEAGFFLPARSGGGYPPFIDFFDYLHKYKHLTVDHRVVIDAMEYVANNLTKIALESDNQQAWKKASSELTAVFVDSDYELRDRNDNSMAIADTFPFLHDHEDIRENRNSTGEFIMTVMRDISGAIQYQRDTDFPTQEAISEKQKEHCAWISTFDRSNIAYSREGALLSAKSYKSQSLSPQALAL